MAGATDLSEVMAVIPVGGSATRLRPLTAEVSKALVRIFDRPLVEYALWELARQGVRQFIFGAKGYINYRGLFDYFGDGTGFSAQYGISPRAHVRYQPRTEDVGSADSVRINMDYYNINGTLLVVQGDNLFELDLREMMGLMEQTGAMMVVALFLAEEVEAYGIADIEGNGRIRRFVEKPRREEAPSRLANAGIYLLSPRVREVYQEEGVREMISVKRRLDFGLDFIPYLIKRGYPVYGYNLKGEWYDVGTPRGYLDTMRKVLTSSQRSQFYLGDPIPGLDRVWIQGKSRQSLERREDLERRVRARTVKMEGSVLVGRHCQIGDGTIVKESTIDNFCIIGNDVTIERSAVLDRVVIEDGAFIQDSIVGRHVHVKSTRQHPTWVMALSVVGDDSVVGQGSVLASRKVEPHTVIPEGTAVSASARSEL